MKKITPILIGSTIFLVLIFFSLMTTPQYSVFQLARAMGRHDISAAERFVDIDGLSGQVSEAATAALKEQVLDKPSTSTNQWEAAGEALGKVLIEGMIPGLKAKFKEAFSQGIKEVFSGKSESNNDTVTKLPDIKKYTWRDLLPGGRLQFKADGKDALLSINSQAGDEIIFRLKKESWNYWKIVEWENIEELMKKWPAQTPESEETVQTPIKAKLGDRIDIGSSWFLTIGIPEEYVPKNTYETPSADEKFITVEVTYENTGTDTGDFSLSNVTLKDNQDHQFKREYSGRKPAIEDADLPGGQKVKGYLTFKVPKDSEGFRVIYSNSRGLTVIFE